MIDSVLGVILAGGLSSRMGTDKANLIINHKSMLENATDLLRSSKVNTICVSGREYGSHWVLDVFPNLGPLGGLYAVIKSGKYKQYKYILVIPVDMPLLASSVILKLINQVQISQAICYYQYPLPILLENNKFLAKQLEILIDNGSVNTTQVRSFKALTSRLTTSYINSEQIDPLYFSNMNTMSDFVKCNQ